MAPSELRQDVDLGRRRPVAELVEEAVRQLVGEARLHRVRDELLAWCPGRGAPVRDQ